MRATDHGAVWFSISHVAAAVVFAAAATAATWVFGSSTHVAGQIVLTIPLAATRSTVAFLKIPISSKYRVLLIDTSDNSVARSFVLAHGTPVRIGDFELLHVQTFDIVVRPLHQTWPRTILDFLTEHRQFALVLGFAILLLRDEAVRLAGRIGTGLLAAVALSVTAPLVQELGGPAIPDSFVPTIAALAFAFGVALASLKPTETLIEKATQRIAMSFFVTTFAPNVAETFGVAIDVALAASLMLPLFTPTAGVWFIGVMALGIGFGAENWAPLTLVGVAALFLQVRFARLLGTAPQTDAERRRDLPNA